MHCNVQVSRTEELTDQAFNNNRCSDQRGQIGPGQPGSGDQDWHFSGYSSGTGQAGRIVGWQLSVIVSRESVGKHLWHPRQPGQPWQLPSHQLANQRPVFGSCYHSRPIRGQYSITSTSRNLAFPITSKCLDCHPHYTSKCLSATVILNSI